MYHGAHLEVIDVLVAPLPDVVLDGRRGDLLAGQDSGVNAHHQHLFVVGSVENTDLAVLGQLAHEPVGVGRRERRHPRDLLEVAMDAQDRAAVSPQMTP